MFVLVLGYLVFGAMPASTVPLALLGVLAIIGLGMAIGLLCSPFALLYDDVSNGLALVVQIWMYITPVVYAPVMTGSSRVLNLVNPISPLLCQTRDWILTGRFTFVFPTAVVTSVTVATIAFGFVVYRIALPRAIERLSS